MERVTCPVYRVAEPDVLFESMCLYFPLSFYPDSLPAPCAPMRLWEGLCCQLLRILLWEGSLQSPGPSDPSAS